MAKGYTNINNELFEFLYCNNLNASELKILLFLIRYTKGFKRDTCRASYSYIAKGVGMNTETVRKSVKGLINKNLLSVEYKAIGSKAQVVKLLYNNCTTSYPTNRPPLIQQLEDNLIQQTYHQDIKEENKDKENKDKKENTHFFSYQKELSQEEWDKRRMEDFDD